ncbi:MAG: TRAP transporter small permease [Deltaproteobacteria bacterium]|nr:TRAP transporter small permease [Deltaproteobacteria bacterium]
MNKIIRGLDGLIDSVNKALMASAGVLLIAMVCLATLNVILRKAGFPMNGAFEIMGFFGALVASFAMGQTLKAGEHIAIDVIVKMLPRVVQRIFLTANDIVSAVFFGLAAWKIIVLGTNLWRVNDLSETLRIPYFPFLYGVAFGSIVMTLMIIVEGAKRFVPPGEVKP